jgi:hypothetical protein
MPRSFTDHEEEDAEIIARCPTSSFSTPMANVPVPIRPFKRVKMEEGEDAEEVQADPSSPSRPLSPRMLDMDQVCFILFFGFDMPFFASLISALQAVVLATSLDEEEEEVLEPTQPVPAEEEEGEVSPSPLVRCNTIAL